MNARHQFTTAPLEDGMAYLCCGCDDERAGPLAYCASCEAVTESYAHPNDGRVTGTTLTRLEADTLASCQLIALKRLDRIAAAAVRVGA